MMAQYFHGNHWFLYLLGSSIVARAEAGLHLFRWCIIYQQNQSLTKFDFNLKSEGRSFGLYCTAIVLLPIPICKLFDMRLQMEQLGLNYFHDYYWIDL